MREIMHLPHKFLSYAAVWRGASTLSFTFALLATQLIVSRSASFRTADDSFKGQESSEPSHVVDGAAIPVIHRGCLHFGS